MYNNEMHKKTERVYADTSVFYGVFAQKFEQDTKPFWDAVADGKVRLIVSDVLEGEIERAPQNVRDFFDLLSESQIERVVSTDESDALAERYTVNGMKLFFS